ncbi:GNAT family N-acetyltransferase [Plastoroseomonas hellenica]|uniref:GNAT family N-acetyltransferase n=1 Tax=Plastoroseomonas hellenica TaxID=2687306 RepID=UPI001BA9E8D2|nr:GNAT family N-acetyltransferase [Plastoroseomonas hellenica]
MIRTARPGDRAAVEAVVHAAYAPYVARMGREPGPMGDDYGALIAAGHVRVLEDEAGVAGILVLIPEADALLLDNVALADRARGRGFGRRLVARAEAEARAAGLQRLRLYTHVLMTENHTLYAHLGFHETHRATEKGFERVYMEKPLTG